MYKKVITRLQRFKRNRKSKRTVGHNEKLHNIQILFTTDPCIYQLREAGGACIMHLIYEK
jgi:hypothetical protein